VDEVVSLEGFSIDLPKEQHLGPFNWIITGSAGIGSWVDERHLEKYVFDLPLFNKTECLTFATKLSSKLGINLEDKIGIPGAGMDDWLEERFGGVVGCIAEMLLDITKDNTVSQHILALSGRINGTISKVAKRRSLSEAQLASVWLKEIQSADCTWKCLRDAGLCGSSAPHGVIFTRILMWLCTFYPAVDLLYLVSSFRLMFSSDPGLDGCLLELEEILKLRVNRLITASLLTLIDQNWIVNKSIIMPPLGSTMTVWTYKESLSILSNLEGNSLSSESSWYLIQVPNGFDVIDVVFVDITVAAPSIYGIQITRSTKPFAKHHTFDTCSSSSKERLKKLWHLIYHHFNVDETTVSIFYVMLAPNCDKDETKPPVRHTSDFYFSSSSIHRPAPIPTRRNKRRSST